MMDDNHYLFGEDGDDSAGDSASGVTSEHYLNSIFKIFEDEREEYAHNEIVIKYLQLVERISEASNGTFNVPLIQARTLYHMFMLILDHLDNDLTEVAVALSYTVSCIMVPEMNTTFNYHVKNLISDALNLPMFEFVKVKEN